LRDQIAGDPLLPLAVARPHLFLTISSHTRWASIGAITEPNCHPVDNLTQEDVNTAKGIIHACLNGDIDNYLELKKSAEAEGRSFPPEITTDTKIIPVQIEKYIQQGIDVPEAFRRAVNDFEGSHAIAMHTDLAPGKFFLAQKGSGQAVFVGLAPDHYMPTSEVYGFIEETDRFLKMDGEKVVDGLHGKTQGQIFILDQNSPGGTDGIQAMYYDGTPIAIGPDEIKRTEITSRDIDRQDFPHYFLKEISESPVSVEKTLQNRWKIDATTDQHCIALDESAFPKTLVAALTADRIRRVFFMGQGTAGVAALACANVLQHYLNEPGLQINALKASELSGSHLDEHDHATSLADTLVVAISQSGTTTDTNRTVDMVKARGAHTLAIVNRRDSDITFKVDGVVYTSSGRDIEMSVASTKAFYSQIVAGTVLGLKIAAIKGRRSAAFISEEIKDLLALPMQMRKVLDLREAIAASARRHAGTKTYWAAVGSGPNKASADEIRIKLSELCYKTISSDFVEDKKHIDLSSEPLIIVCAAGSKGTVIGDIIKDTAIFKAHKATPIVIADEGDDRFAPYAEDVFHVPAVSPHLAPILNTLVGHIWGYYAALAINEGSRLLHDFRREIQATINDHMDQGLNIYEILLEKTFREKIALFYNAFRSKRSEIQWPTAIALASDLTLLLKYLAGRLPVSDFEIDFGQKGTAKNMLETLFTYLGESINQMARPVDAIKHQAKTVTVGTSRISEAVEGILFEALAANNFDASHLINRNVIVLKNLQAVVAGIEGSILYAIGKLDLLGELTDESSIEVLKKTGVLAPLPSRVETDTRLKGTKKIIVRQGNIYIGKGRKDDRSIIVIPIISGEKSLNTIDHLLLLNIRFKPEVALEAKIKALGGKFEHIKNIVQENSIDWEDAYLDKIAIDELFGRSAEKVSDYLLQQI
jgi:glucosamine--fructose-6-phosphate aminotransferase (isomerizing)